MIYAFLTFILGFIYSDILEYFSHKFLHRFSAKKWGILSVHWRKHHVQSRRNSMKDDPGGSELVYIALVGALHFPLLWWIAPWAFVALMVASVEYLYVHWRSHIDPEWALHNVPYHLAHHMGDQNRNWGVRRAWVDRLMGTNQLETM